MTTAVADDTTTTTAADQAATTTSAASAAADSAAAQAAATTGQTTTASGPDASAKVPDTYVLTVPDGSPIKDQLDQIAARAKVLQLTQTQAQALAQQAHDDVLATQAARDRAYDAIKADPVLGGAHLEATHQHAQRALRHLFGAEEAAARETFTRLGLDNDPVFVRAFAMFGKSLAEDTSVGGRSGGQASGTKSTADILYPSTAKA